MQDIEKTQWITIRFCHPKLIDRILKVHPTDILGQIRQVIGQSTLLYLFNNYHFQQKSQKLPELQPIVNCVNPDHPIDIVLDSYNQITAKHHLSTVAHILKNPNIYTYILKLHKGEPIIHQFHHPEQLPAIQNFDFNQLVNTNFSNSFLKTSTQSQITNFVSFMCSSGFNPPPITQKFNGDLFYIHIRTLECYDYHVTATPQGFFINQSKISHYNPQISNSNKTIYISLIDLLRTVSEKFKNNLDKYVIDKKVTETQIFKMQSINKNNSSRWLQNCQSEHTWNSKKLLEIDTKSEKIGMKDWNQMFQLKNSITYGHKIDSSYKYKFFSKLYSQFEEAAIEGAKALVDGKIPPLNPMDETKKHIYIYDNIFYSIANQTPYDHSQEKGQDATPSTSAINTDLINLSILDQLSIPQLHVLHMVVVSYRGFRVIAQCIIPGILTGDHASCSQYGSIDDGKTIQTNKDFQKLMIEVCQKLNLEDSIMVKDGEGVQKRIACSPDVKGILGSDRRKYILDLLRLSPRDLNYIGPSNEICVVRPELVKAFLSTKTTSQMPRINTNIGTQISFVKNENTQKQQQLLQQMAKYIVNTAVPQLINGLKTTFNRYLTDSKGISSAFHRFGINIRYLGYVCTHQMLRDNKQIQIVLIRVMLVRSLKHLFRMAMRETNILYLNETLVNLLNSIFGNKHHIALMEEGGATLQGYVDGNDSKKKKKKKNKQQKGDEIQGQENMQTTPIKVPVSAYLLMKPSQLWNIVRKICQCRYSFELEQNIQKMQLFKFPCQKLATLRDLCLNIGIKLQKKRYNIINEDHQSQKSLPFSIKNITEICALPKRKQIISTEITQLIQEADLHSDKYEINQAIQKYNKANEELINLTGGLVLQLAHVRSKMGKIFYVIGEHESAIMAETAALQITQALESEDSAKAVQSYSTLGLYYSVKGQKQKAFYYIYKSINLMLISFGQTHPDFLINVSNLARIHHQNKQYNKASDLYLQAISIISIINGKDHLKVSFCYSALASLHFEMADCKRAIDYQNESVNILTKILPENDVRLSDSKKIQKLYRQVNITNNNNFNQINPIAAELNNKKQEQDKQDGKRKKQTKKQ